MRIRWVYFFAGKNQGQFRLTTIPLDEYSIEMDPMEYYHPNTVWKGVSYLLLKPEDKEFKNVQREALRIKYPEILRS